MLYKSVLTNKQFTICLNPMAGELLANLTCWTRKPISCSSIYLILVALAIETSGNTCTYVL